MTESLKSMEIPEYKKFAIENTAELQSNFERLKLDIPLSKNHAILSSPVSIGRRQIPNRLCIQPMEGCDAEQDGSPGALTHRRYIRYAEGGAGLIWVEATAITPNAKSRENQLYLHKNNLQAFRQLVTAMRQAAMQSRGCDLIIILQLAYNGRDFGNPVIVHHNPDLDAGSGIHDTYPVATDSELENIRDDFIAAAGLAAAAGFDGIDIKTCHNDLLGELLGARTREGIYGGSFENRTRLILDILAEIRKRNPDLLLTTRTSIYDANAYPYGFGVSRDDPNETDLSEPKRLAGLLADAGVSILNISPAEARHSQTQSLPEAQLLEAERKIALTRAIQEAVPDTIVVGGDISLFRQFAPQVAAGIIEQGGATLMGLGRLALAYPNAIADLLDNGKLDPKKTCMLCGACINLIRNAAPTGCVIRDKEVYGPEYRRQRQFSLDRLRHEAQRCHNCESAPCRTACPNGIDVPAFLKAFADDNISDAYAILKQSNILPEMCSHLCPARMLCEGSCIESTLTGTPIPIRDIQYVVSWLAREEINIGINFPSEPTGTNIAIVGAGPAGLGAAAILAECGHCITLFERGERLGGTPQAFIPASRYPGAQLEIAARFQPAIDAGRIKICRRQELGLNLTLDDLRQTHDAVLLATGLWQEQRLSGTPPDGVTNALMFLSEAKQGIAPAIPRSIAILAGGDSAMDAAREAKRLGAQNIYIIYGKSRADMHWHMDEAWSASKGVHMLTLTEPVGYSTNTNGNLTGLKCRRTDIIDNPLFEIPVQMVIEAMGLQIDDNTRKALPGIEFTKIGLVKTTQDNPFSTTLKGVFTAGAMINGGASAAQCIAEGMQVAGTIDKFISANLKSS
jgi:NADPH-dependent glutamate synthase beta subunit-like oxidoreductase/2,4-dienoyl-CoA reductase-like NADH-dependent reductase (Old Yellow Enzyme family)